MHEELQRIAVPMAKAEFPMVDVLKVRPLDGHKLWLRFTDGSEGVRDLSDVVGKSGSMVEPLQSPEFFARVFNNPAFRLGRTASTSIRSISTSNCATQAR